MILGVLTIPLMAFSAVPIRIPAAAILIVVYILICQYQVFQNNLLLSIIKSFGFVILSIISISIIYIIIAIVVGSVL